MPLKYHLVALKLFKLCFCVLLSSCFYTAYAQKKEVPVTQIIDGLNKHSALFPIEKVYLHFDKHYYTAGDIMWFRAYTTIGANHHLSARSGILNVEVVNAKNKVVQGLRLALQAGMASGSILLPDSLQAGAYSVRAYTNWMRNEGSAYYFNQNFYIDNALTGNIISTATYKYQQVGADKQITANIHFATAADGPFANQEVKYVVAGNGKNTIAGKGITDAAGNLHIVFKSLAPANSTPTIETIITPVKRAIKKTFIVQPDAAALSIKFFPESGYLVSGLPAIVAFKAIGSNGLGKNITGTVIDDANQQVAQFQSSHLGMGSFLFTPQPGKTYQAHITDNGVENIINMPAARTTGYIMRVFNDDSAQVVLSVLSNTMADTASTLHLIAQSNGQVCFAASIKTRGAKPVALTIPKNRFPLGITQFTLFSLTGEPLNERIAFIFNNTGLLSLHLNTNKKTYTPREKVEVDVKVTDLTGKPAKGAFSASVMSEAALGNSEAASSILSNLLLTSDLKGYVENPGYYFTNTNEQTLADLDLLMLTQGYRSVSWQKILNNTAEAPAYDAMHAFSFTGTLKTPGGKPVVGGKVRLLTTNGPPVIIDTLSDANGRFGFHDLTFKDSTRFALQANAQKGGSNVIIQLDSTNLAGDRNFIAQFTGVADSVPGSYLKNSEDRFQQDLALGMGDHSYLLKEVVINDTRATPPELHTSNLNGPGHATVIINGDELRDRGCSTLASCLIGRLIGVIIGVDGVARAPKNNNSLTKGDGTLAIRLDGGFLSPTALNDVNPSDVASVELIMDPVDLGIYGTAGVNGIIQINTRNGTEPGKPLPRSTNMLSFNPIGFHTVREFYSPDYSVSNNLKNADLRTTISWQPQLFTDANGNAKFSYYNPDGKGTYLITIEGIDINGNLGTQVYRYKVE